MHELTSEVISRIEVRGEEHGHAGNDNNSGGSVCVWVGLHVMNEGGSGFVNASELSVTNARQVGMRMLSKCTGTHRHARIDANNASEKMKHTRTWVLQVARTMEEQI